MGIIFGNKDSLSTAQLDVEDDVAKAFPGDESAQRKVAEELKRLAEGPPITINDALTQACRAVRAELETLSVSVQHTEDDQLPVEPDIARRRSSVRVKPVADGSESPAEEDSESVHRIIRRMAEARNATPIVHTWSRR